VSRDQECALEWPNKRFEADAQSRRAAQPIRSVARWEHRQSRCPYDSLGPEADGQI
jgi:hypothetical protein